MIRRCEAQAYVSTAAEGEHMRTYVEVGGCYACAEENYYSLM